VFTPEMIELMRREAQNKNAKELADMIGSTPGSVYAKCYENGIKIKKHQTSAKAIRTELAVTIRSQLDCKANQLGITTETLVRRLITIIVQDDLFNAILEPDEDFANKRNYPYDKT